MIFTKRFINVTFSPPSGAAGAGAASKTYSGLRIIFNCQLQGDPGNGECQLIIFGMPQSDMNRLTLYGYAVNPQLRYQITVEAGDDVNGMGVVFVGDVQQAWADYQMMAQAQVGFHVMAHSAGVAIQQRSKDGNGDYTTYKGKTPVTQILQHIAQLPGWMTEFTGISGLALMNPYIYGSPMRRLQLVREAADIAAVVENGVLAAWPLNQSRPGGTNQIVSAATGMVASPSFTDYGVLVRQEFSRYVKFGTQFTIQSSVTPANKTWTVAQADYSLSTMLPKGPWFITLYGIDPGKSPAYPTRQ